MNRGYVKFWRCSVDNELYFLEPFTKWQAWQDLVLNANHKKGIIQIRGNIVEVDRGQIGWSELTMKNRWSRSRDKVRRFLKWLETRQQIRQQKNALTTVVTILNYDLYQSNDTTNKTTDDTTEKQQTDSRQDTNKNDKNDKNIIYIEDEKINEKILEFIENRKKMKKAQPMTELGITRLVNKIVKRVSDYSAENVGKWIDQAIECNRKTVYPPKEIQNKEKRQSTENKRGSFKFN